MDQALSDLFLLGGGLGVGCIVIFVISYWGLKNKTKKNKKLSKKQKREMMKK